jgi:hypothetical protein
MKDETCRTCAHAWEGWCEHEGEIKDGWWCKRYESYLSPVKGIVSAVLMVVLFYAFIYSAFLIFG